MTSPLTAERKCLQVVYTDVARATWAKLLGGLSTDGQPSYFKFGEGGWAPSKEQSTVEATGSGLFTASGTISGSPLVPATITVNAGGDRVVTDVQHSPWDGTGDLVDSNNVVRGSVNYKTNEWTVTFTSIIPSGQDITVTRKHRGQTTDELMDDIAKGNDTVGPYVGTVGCYPIKPGSVTVTDTGSQTLTDDGAGNLSGDGSGTVDYETGQFSVTFNSLVPTSQYVRAFYRAWGVPKLPDAGKTALDADSDSTLATVSKSFDISTDMVFSGAGTATVQVTMSLGTSEGNDDGTGNPPFWTEGGIYSVNSVLLAYFTMPGLRKTSTKTLSRQINLEFKV